MIKGHGGNIYELAQKLGCAPNDIFDMSSNVNPLGPPEGLVSHLIEHINAINALPEVDGAQAIVSFSNRYGIDPDLVLAANGTTQFIYAIPLALGTKKALIVGPTYADYADACVMHGVDHSFFITEDSREFACDLDRLEQNLGDADTVFICNPNNPTGTFIPLSRLETLCRAHPETRFIIDESYLPFVIDGERHSIVHKNLPNVLVLNSMSKIFRIPGLRVGFLIASEPIIEKFQHYALPWAANSLAQIAVIYLMENREEIDDFVKGTRAFLETEKHRFLQTFQDVPGLRVFPSTTSFVLLKLLGDHRAEAVCEHLADNRLLIRNCSNFEGLSDRFVRVAFKTREVNIMLEEKLLSLFKR
jgi:threonine-phosphate decarboxylase